MIVMEISQNKKIGNCSATYVSQRSCPKTCPFLNNGCYAELGPLGIHSKKISKRKQTKLEIARKESRAILKLTGKNHLRLHIVGDSSTRTGTKLLAKSAETYSTKFGKSVWTYTHSWHKVCRKDWGQISVLASCESLKQIRKARKLGYASAIVVPEFKSNKLYIEGGEKILPCPNQTKGVTCDKCRLCFNDKRLLDAKITVAFAAHGAKRKTVIKSLELIKI